MVRRYIQTLDIYIETRKVSPKLSEPMVIMKILFILMVELIKLISNYTIIIYQIGR